MKSTQPAEPRLPRPSSPNATKLHEASPSGDRIRQLRRGPLGLLRALLALALVAPLASCERAPLARVRWIEFIDESADGSPQPGETLRIHLDRELPPEFDASRVTVDTVPPSTWTPRVSIDGASSRVLRVEILQGFPRLVATGSHDDDAQATALRVGLGDGSFQTIDLQAPALIPVLERVTWLDGVANEPNGVVDEGDRLRMRFSEPVRLALDEGPEGPNDAVRVPQDVILVKEIDRLDDGKTLARFVDDGPPDDAEIDIALGSGAVLRVEGRLPSSPRDRARTSPESPSGLTVHGSSVLPMRRIVPIAGGPGVRSRGAVDIEIEPDRLEPLDRYRPEGGEFFPDGARRSFHTVTGFLERAGLVAIIAGGRSASGAALNDVLEYRPLRASGDLAAFERIGRLPSAVWDHSATVLPGPDHLQGTEDDLLVLAGGVDEDGVARDGIAVVFVATHGDPNKRIVVQALEAGLGIPRWRHAAVATSASEILVDGGWTRHPGNGTVGIAETAEQLTFERRGDEVEVSSRRLFRSIARVDHTLTLLAPDAAGQRWVLAYGGYGRNRYRQPLLAATGAFGDDVAPDQLGNVFTASRRSVLRWPVLIDVADPRRSILDLRAELGLGFLRYRHQAFPQGSWGPEGLIEAEGVMLIGGSLQPPEPERDDAWLFQWDLSDEHLRRTGGQRPAPELAINALAFGWSATSPRDSSFSLVPHPARSPEKVPTRHSFSASSVPGYGFVLAGGELPGAEGEDPVALGTIEAYLTGAGRLAELAADLRSPRTRHGAILVSRDGRRSLLLIGGWVPDGTPDVEEYPLPPEDPRP